MRFAGSANYQQEQFWEHSGPDVRMALGLWWEQLTLALVFQRLEVKQKMSLGNSLVNLTRKTMFLNSAFSKIFP